MRHAAVHPRFRPRRSAAGGEAFTILELMVALAILVAITAIVVPFSGARIREAVRADTTAQIEAAMWSARAEARLHNTPVRIMAVPTERGTSLVAESSRRTAEAPARSRAPLPLADLGEMRIRLHGPGDGASDSDRGADLPADGIETEAVTVATVLPDGAAVVAAGLELVDDRGGAQSLHIDPVALSVTATDAEPEPTDESAEPDPAP